MRIPDPKANTTTEAYLAYKAGYLEENELKPVLYEPYLHFDGWLAYWAGLTSDYPNKGPGKNLMPEAIVDMTDSGGRQSQFYMSLPAGTYTISFDLDSFELGTNSSFGISMSIFGVGGTQITDVGVISINSSTTLGRKYKTFTISSDGTTDNRDNVRIPLVDWNNGARAMLSNIQIEAGDTATTYEPYAIVPEMLCDEEALVAYLSGVTDTYPEDIKDPYDVRIVGYLKHLVSARWPEPDYPVNNQEFYLSTMKPPVVTNDTPSADIELDDTAEAPFIDVKAYGDTSQQTYSGKNLFATSHPGSGSVADITGLNSIYLEKPDKRTGQFYFNPRLPAGSYTLSYKVSKNDTNTEGVRCNISVMKEDGTGTEQIATASVYNGSVSISFTSTTEVSNIYWFISGSLADGSSGDIYDIQLETGSTATAFEPYIGGHPAPNPDYPQDVNVVTGRQVVKVRSKNLWGGQAAYSRDTNGVYFSTTPDGYIYGRGTATNNAYSITGQLAQSEGVYISLTAGTYYLSLEEELPTGAAIQVVRTADSDTIRDGVGSFTLAADTNVAVRVVVQKGVDVSGGFTAHPMLEESATKTGYAPYGADYEINLGKNLFTFGTGSGKFQGITWTRNGDTAVGVGTATGSYTDTGTRIELPAPLKAGQDYVFSIPAPVSFGCSLYLFDKNDQVVSPSAKISAGETSIVFSKDVDIYKARITLSDYGGAGKELNVELKAQIELGSVASEWAPQFEPIELCKIGDYQDYIYRDEDDDWYIHKATNKFVVNGSESEWVSSAVSGGRQFYIPLPGVSLVSPRQIYCDRFYFITGSTDENTTYVNSTGLWVIYKPTSNGVAVATTTNEFKTWLGSNITTAYYTLATATDTLITDNNLIAQLNALVEGGSYEGKTYIKVTATDPNLPALLKVEAGEYD